MGAIGRFFKRSWCWLKCKTTGKVEIQGGGNNPGDVKIDEGSAEVGIDLMRDCSHCWGEKK